MKGCRNSEIADAADVVAQGMAPVSANIRRTTPMLALFPFLSRSIPRPHRLRRAASRHPEKAGRLPVSEEIRQPAHCLYLAACCINAW